MDVDTVLAEVPINIMSLLDDGDFKTRETTVAFNAAGMDLVWNFVTTGGAFTQTAVTPTSGGDYDWTHQGDGMYTIEIPAAGGASINNDTEGFGWFTGLVTGVLPWRGPIIGFRAAALNNSMVDGTTIDVNTTLIEGSDATNQIRDSILTDATRFAGANVDAAISTRATPSQVNAEVLDVLNVDTFTEPGQEAPPATTTLAVRLRYLYKALRNRFTQTSTEFKLYADNATTVDQKATVSDDGTTFDRGEIGTGP